MKIRADLIKIAKNLHTWVGISAGIFLFICFFAAGLTMFQHDLSKWAAPPQQQLPAIETNQYNQLVEKVQQQYPETLKGFTLSFHAKEGFNAPMFWDAPHEEAEQDHHFDSAQTTILASLDKQGNLIVQQENISKIGWLIEQLHETAGIPGMLGHHTLGVYVMGVVAVLYFLAMMSGLIVLLPTLVKDYFAIRPGKNKKRFWLDTHNVIGITSLPFHIIIAISVIVFAFHDLFYGALGQLAFKDKPLFERPAPMVLAETQPKLNVENIYHRLQQSAPDYRVDGIRVNNLDTPEKASGFAALYSPNQMLRGDNFDYMSFNPYQTEAFKTNTLDTQSSVAEKVIKSMFSLHFGNFGGDITRWIYLLFGIGGAYLFYSGNILWVETRLKKQKTASMPIPQQRNDVKFMANLTIGACLGCVLGIFGSLSAIRWFYVISPNPDNINLLMMYSYYAIFIISIVYAFVTGAAKALPHLLLAIAIILFTIPVTSLIAWVWPDLGLWYAKGSLLWIDLFALIFAVCFLRFYQQANARRKIAPVGSIWAIKHPVNPEA
ncbi:PepSY-associated TM helix domain-containing protein [Acinetobacter puyangensis]|uniref:Uncharacterized iron-regulated membrane protein n=1 Tax=Acinetobacter puyangensis TaxID=1096779 RepID=A0A240E5H6_9GAMM|nr:PepSY-associated TM helix domain-containing protein [Acinetobacter puyangensis]SNX43836.1 Uncharacterized iron-regulated membrane protein [Acinetobacter puyangensis]